MKTLLALIFGVVLAASYPAPTGNISDFANVLTSEQKADIEQELQSFREKTGNEIAVAIIKSLDGDTIENYAVKLFEQWKIGQKGKDNGILLLVSIDDHKLKIEVGYGLEPYVTDARAGDIIRNNITPEFKKGDYYSGIKQGVLGIEKYLSGEKATTSSVNLNFSQVIFEGVIPFVFLMGWLIIPLLVYIAAFFGRSKRIWPGGLVGAILGFIIFSWLGIIIFGFIGLFLDWILSRNYETLSKMGKKTNWWKTGGGFWTGGSSGGGSSFGGFSGGSSGGGGSSGSW